MTTYNLQPTLSNEYVKIRPLRETDFETLYLIASDPLIWEQHPSSDRYKREVFQIYFDGAIESKGAFLIFDSKTDEPIGCSRFYDLNEKDKSVLIGYTFLARDHWGTTHNRALKTLMLNHAFTFVEKVFFHIGGKNIRSQIAIQKLGAKKIEEVQIAYYGEKENLNFQYEIEKAMWKNNQL